MVKILYWVLFLLSVVVLFLNFGLGLMTVGLVILPVLILHAGIGFSLGRLNANKGLVAWSMLNLLVFALIRPDGVHAFNETGLGALLSLFGMHGGYSHRNEDLFFFASLALLLIQLIVDLRLRRLARS